MRDGSFIKGDMDIDVGVIGRDKLLFLVGRLKSSAFRIKFSPARSRLKLRHANGVRIDVKLFEPHGNDGYLWATFLPNCHWLQFINNTRELLPLRQRRFEGIDVWVPNKPESVLAEQYGANWMTPTSDYHYILDRNLDDQVTRKLAIRSATCLVFSSCRKGKLKTARVLADRLSRLEPQRTLWVDVLAALDRLASSSA